MPAFLIFRGSVVSSTTASPVGFSSIVVLGSFASCPWRSLDGAGGCTVPVPVIVGDVLSPGFFSGGGLIRGVPVLGVGATALATPGGGSVFSGSGAATTSLGGGVTGAATSGGFSGGFSSGLGGRSFWGGG